jgi:hypothetical protein
VSFRTSNLLFLVLTKQVQQTPLFRFETPTVGLEFAKFNIQEFSLRVGIEQTFGKF